MQQYDNFIEIYMEHQIYANLTTNLWEPSSRVPLNLDPGFKPKFFQKNLGGHPRPPLAILGAPPALKTLKYQTF